MGKRNVEIKVSREENVDNNKLVLLFCIVIGIIFIVLFFRAIGNYVFVPATMIMACLEAFAVGYYFRKDEKKKNLVYILFILGVILLMGAIIYTCMRTI